MINERADPDAGIAGYQELVNFEIDAVTFAADWGHCDQMSSHLANLVSYKRRDPLFYSNLLSSVLNELLEIAFRMHAPGGHVACRIMHAGPADRIMVTIPSDTKVKSFFEEAVALTREGDVRDRYVNCLLDEEAFDMRTGLLELAVDYQARLSVEPDGEGAIRLVADLVLEGPET